MAETIGTAYIQIEPSFQGVNTAIENQMSGAGQAGGQAFGSGFAKVIGGVGKGALGIATLAAGAVTAVGGAFVNAANGVSEYGDDIDKMSQKMGMSAQAYQEWEAVMQHSGTSMETMKASMKTLANAAETGKDAFDQLGISQEQIATMSQEQLFETTIAGLQGIEDTTQRTYLAGQLLGRGATELGALLNTSAEDTQAMRDRVHELGGVMSDEAVSAAAAYQDQLQDMKTAFSGLSRNMLSEFLPSITQVMGGLTEIFSGNSGGVEMINEGISSIISGITDALPQIMEVAASIVESLATALLENLGPLLDCALDIITQLLMFVVDNLPMIITTIIDLAIQLINAVVAAFPQIVEALVNAMPQVIDAICEGLIVAIPALIQGAITLVTVLLEHLPEIIMGLVQAAPQILEAIAQGLIASGPILLEGFANIFTQAVTKLVEWGAQLKEKASTAFSNLIATIKQWLSQAPQQMAYFAGQMVAKFINFIVQLPGKVATTFSNLINKIVEFGRNFVTKAQETARDFGEKLINGLLELPSKLINIGHDIVEGLKNGISNAWTGLTDWVQDLAGNLIEGFKDTLKIGSPSKAFADDVGQWIPAGIAEGIESGMDVLDNTIDTMTSDMITTANLDMVADSTAAVASADDTDGDLTGMLAQYLPALLKATQNGTVVLSPDAQGIFKMVRGENSVYKRMTGASAFE